MHAVPEGQLPRPAPPPANASQPTFKVVRVNPPPAPVITACSSVWTQQRGGMLRAVRFKPVVVAGRAGLQLAALSVGPWKTACV